jgi:putative salt-induced outer membrane protein YdiY
MRSSVVIAAVLCLAGFTGPVRCAYAAPKTDVLTFANGDRLTGEVKGLAQGKLQFNTDATNTIAIEWDKVASLETKQILQVELASGLRYLGQADRPPAAGSLHVAYGDEASGRDVALTDIVRIDVIDQGQLIDRLDGYVTAGYNYTKASAVQTFTFTGGIRTRNERRELALNGSTTATSEKDDEDTKRFDLQGTYRRLLPNRYFYLGFAGLEGNDALGLDLRTTLGGGYGRYLLQDRRREWTAFGGLAVNREDFEESDQRDSIEGVIGTTFSFFRFDSPEANLDATLVLLPSLTESGRFRSEATVKSRYEIVEDLFFEISLYGSYDNEPDQNADSDSDYGVTTSLGYSF